MTAATSYFTDRCDVAVEFARDSWAPCGLKRGHEGPHEPVKLGKQTTDESPAASRVRRSARCKECEVKAAHMAIAAKLGASEWEGLIDRVPRCEKCEPQAVYAARSHGDKLSVDLVSAWDALRSRLDIAESQILAIHWHTYEMLLHGD